MENKIIHTTTTKTGKTVSFRYPTIKDAEILMNYINKISAEKSFILFQGEQKTLVEEKKWLKSKLESVKENKAAFIIATIDNELVGSTEIELLPMAKKHIGSFGITVAKKFRREGIGKKMMELVIKESIKKIKDLKIIDLEVFGQNPIAQNLYKKMGFIEYGCLPKSLKRRGKFDDAILMYKKVR